MSKQHKQTRKRASHSNGVSVKKSGSEESSGDREKSTAKINYLRLCIIAVVLCVTFTFVLLWSKASFAASLVKQQSPQTAATTAENKSPKKHSQPDDNHDVKSENQKGILSNLFIDFC